MGKEVERKFLVNGNEWREGSRAVHTCQGYLAMTDECTVRVRLQEETGYLTIKGKQQGISRLEYEYEIPPGEAEELLTRLCMQPYIEKNRYDVMYAGMKWEIDEFLKENEGLVVAEVELQSEDQQIELPPWLGGEVSGDPRYGNASLARNPYSRWGR